MVDIITQCELGKTYKCCCVTYNDIDFCCYAGTCDEYKEEN